MKSEYKIFIQELQKKNRKVFEHLFKEHYGSLVRFAEGILFDPFLAEDVVQNLFFHIWDKSVQFDINTSLKAYLYQSVKNRCLNRLKSIQVRDKNNWLYIEGLLNSPDTDIYVEDTNKLFISKAVQELAGQQLKIVQLKYYENKKYLEIAESLNISINTVKTQLSRVKYKLRKILFKTIVLALFFIGH